MTNSEIEHRFEIVVKKERLAAVAAIELISLIDQRRIYLERGYPSLFAYLTQKFRYSEGAANRRIAAARVRRDVPEVSEKLQSGALNLTTIAKAYKFIKTASATKKREALKIVEGKSAVKAEQALFSLFPETVVRVETIRVNSENSFHLSATVPNEVMERFQQVRDILSNAIPNASFVEVADYLFKKELNTAAAAKHRVNPKNKTVTPRTKVSVRKPCEYVDPETGKVCGSTYMLHVDHIIPRAFGGTNAPSNLRSLCASHNQWLGRMLFNRRP